MAGYCPAECRTCARIRRGVIEAAAAGGLAALDARMLAEAAGVGVAAVERHGPGSVEGWVSAAYLESTRLLQHNFDVDFAPALTWCDGIRRATEGLVCTLAEDPARARFSYVEVLNGDTRLRTLREHVRHESVALFEREYTARHGDEGVPSGRLELACNVIIHTIATHAREGRAAELPGALEAMLVAAGTVDERL